MNWIWFAIGIAMGIPLGIYCRRWFFHWRMLNQIKNMVLIRFIFKSGKQISLLVDNDMVGE